MTVYCENHTKHINAKEEKCIIILLLNKWYLLCEIFFVPVLIGVVGPGIIQQHDRVGLTVRQRKFPGPAGLLPDKVGGALASVIGQLSIKIVAF
jgi:hypothetical protein